MNFFPRMAVATDGRADPPPAVTENRAWLFTKAQSAGPGADNVATAFGLRGACSRFCAFLRIRQRQQAGRTPRASRGRAPAAAPTPPAGRVRRGEGRNQLLHEPQGPIQPPKSVELPREAGENKNAPSGLSARGRDKKAQHSTLPEYPRNVGQMQSFYPGIGPNNGAGHTRRAKASRKNNMSNSGWFFWPLAALLARCRSPWICASLAPCQRSKLLRHNCSRYFFVTPKPKPPRSNPNGSDF